MYQNFCPLGTGSEGGDKGGRIPPFCFQLFLYNEFSELLPQRKLKEKKTPNMSGFTKKLMVDFILKYFCLIVFHYENLKDANDFKH